MGIRKKKLTVTKEQKVFHLCHKDSWSNVIVVANNDIHKVPKGIKIKLERVSFTTQCSKLD